MWQELNIENAKYFLMCNINADTVKCVFVNANENWCEAAQLQQIVERAKQLNKRIKYDAATVAETLQTQSPSSAELCNDDAPQESQKVLKLKYRLQATLPFNFEWQLRKQTEFEFKSAILLPLFCAVNGMSQQIAELREVVRKKDLEIKQYRTEGAILRRTTVVTEIFDFLRFDDKYTNVNKLAAGFDKMAEFFMENQVLNEAAAAPIVDIKTVVKQEPVELRAHTPSISNVLNKLSPRNRKRKVLAVKERHKQERLRARQQKLSFENSETLSQVLSEEKNEEQELHSNSNNNNNADVTAAIANDRNDDDVNDNEVEIIVSNAIANDSINVLEDDIDLEFEAALSRLQAISAER